MAGGARPQHRDSGRGRRAQSVASGPAVITRPAGWPTGWNQALRASDSSGRPDDDGDDEESASEPQKGGGQEGENGSEG